jgi:hypothetical protein
MTSITVTDPGHHGTMPEDRPQLQPAAADLWCWLHAAFPTGPDGGLDVELIARALEVNIDTVWRWTTDRYFDPGDLTDTVTTPDHVRALARRWAVTMTTIRRWIEEDDLDAEQWATLRRRAILRGKGHPLWPRLDDHMITMQTRARHNATRSWHNATTTPPARLPAAWNTQGWLEPHLVIIAHHPRAWVNRVTITRTDSPRRARTLTGAELTDQAQAPNRFAAVVIQHAVLEHIEPWRALPPSELLPAGRTEAWRDIAPAVDLTDLAKATLTAGH